jgi:transposase
MKRSRQRVDVDLTELDQLLEQALEGPLSRPDYQKLKSTLHTLVELLTPSRNTEKTNAVLPEKDIAPASEAKPTAEKPSRPGHGRNGADAFSGAQKIRVPHAQLNSGDVCPECETGKVYTLKKSKPLVRVIGQAPLAATVYEFWKG